MAWTVIARCFFCDTVIARAEHVTNRTGRVDFPRPYAICVHSGLSDKIHCSFEWVPEDVPGNLKNLIVKET